MANVLIVAEQRDGKLRSPSLNAFTFGKQLAEVAGGQLITLVIGSGIEAAANEAAKYGANKVVSVDDPALGTYLAETYAPVVAQVAKAQSASVIAATATAFGKDLLPRVAAQLGAGMASDVVAIAGPKSFKRPMIAGNVLASVEVTTPVVVVSVRQTEFQAAKPGDSIAPIEKAAAGTVDARGAQVLRFEEVKSSRPDLAEAKVVVSGGRGMKAAENFKHLEELTDMLGGALGATRAACDAGMVPNDLQVGQTGKVVAPDLYIAVGVSGALQHLAGMKSSRVIVAINKDSEAPIFQVADYGLVAKWEDSLPGLIDKVKAIKAGS